MSTKQLLTEYILQHPDFWEFENELKEVERLTELCRNEVIIQNIETVNTAVSSSLDGLVFSQIGQV